jgi:hypothetical protein
MSCLLLENTSVIGMWAMVENVQYAIRSPIESNAPQAAVLITCTVLIERESIISMHSHVEATQS